MVAPEFCGESKFLTPFDFAIQIMLSALRFMHYIPHPAPRNPFSAPRNSYPATRLGHILLFFGSFFDEILGYALRNLFVGGKFHRKLSLSLGQRS